MDIDKDLMSIQEVRNAIGNAYEAQKILATYSQEKIDKICYAVAKAGYESAAETGRLAHEETGYGNAGDKEIKNKFAAKNVYNRIKDMKTVGVIKGDLDSDIMEVAIPVGVVAAIIPSTNPTSTVIYKMLIGLKSGNAIVISPHPAAKKTILKLFEILNTAAIKAGMPEGCLQCIESPTMNGTEALMKDKRLNLILATGGNAMVNAAYSSGNPALGVGAGNGPAFIERSADIQSAISQIVESKTFDNGTVCSSEQSIVVEKAIENNVITEMEKKGCYFLSSQQAKQLSKYMLRANYTMNPQIVGKDVQTIAQLADLEIPSNAKILVAREENVGLEYPFSMEKLCPILAFYVEDNWQDACDRSIEILNHEGAGHTMTIHSTNKKIIHEFAIRKPVSRLLVNTSASLGGIGATTNLFPALTLGSGAVGKSATSDNVSPMNLLNIRRVANQVRTSQEVIEEFQQPFSNNEDFETKSEEFIISDIVAQVMEQLSINKN